MLIGRPARTVIRFRNPIERSDTRPFMILLKVGCATENGTLERYIRDYSIRGLTSNPTIFRPTFEFTSGVEPDSIVAAAKSLLVQE
jgi:hypothetical protein